MHHLTLHRHRPQISVNKIEFFIGNDQQDDSNDNITFTDEDLIQAVNLAVFSNDRLKT